LHTDHTDIKNTRSQIKQSIHDEIAQSITNPNAQVDLHRLFMLLHMGKEKLANLRNRSQLECEKYVED